MRLTSMGKSKSKGALNRIDELEAEVVALSAENQQNLAKIAELFAENERLREDKALLLQPESLMAQFSTGDGSADVARLRTYLCDLQCVVASAQQAIDQLTTATPATSRAGYLRSLPELIGSPPAGRSSDRGSRVPMLHDGQDDV